MGVTIRFYPITEEEYESWVNMQGKNRYILTLLGRKLTARQIAAVTRILAEQDMNIDAIKRLTGRIPLMSVKCIPEPVLNSRFAVLPGIKKLCRDS